MPHRSPQQLKRRRSVIALSSAVASNRLESAAGFDALENLNEMTSDAIIYFEDHFKNNANLDSRKETRENIQPLCLSFIANMMQERDSKKTDAWFDATLRPVLDLDCMSKENVVTFFKMFLRHSATPLIVTFNNAKMGRRVKVLAQLALSYFDIVTDLAMLNHFYKFGRTFFWVSLAFLLTANLFQVVVVFVQHRRKPKRVLYRKMLAALFFLGPLMATADLVKTTQKVSNEEWNPAVYFFHVRGVELALESLPEVILQVLALLLSSADGKIHLTTIQLLSIVASVSEVRPPLCSPSPPLLTHPAPAPLRCR